MQKQSKKWLFVTSLDGKETRDFSASHVARVTGYDLRTVNAWCDGRPIPEPARRFLALVLLGCLPAPDWHRWRVVGRQLLNLDDGQAFDCRDLAADYVMRQQLADARRQIAALESVARSRERVLSSALIGRRCIPAWHRSDSRRPVQGSLFDDFQTQKSPG